MFWPFLSIFLMNNFAILNLECFIDKLYLLFNIDMKFLKGERFGNKAAKSNHSEFLDIENQQNAPCIQTKKASLQILSNTNIKQNEQRILHQKSKQECAQAIQPYKMQVLLHLMSLPKHGPFPLCNYFPQQKDITQHMRLILLNWLIDVQLKYKLSTETFFAAVTILDQYLSIKNVQRDELQLLGITAMWIAAKYQETYQVPTISNLVYVCDLAYTQKQILGMEGDILSQCQFNILQPSGLTYFDIINAEIKLSPKEYFLGRYILEITIFQIQMRKYLPKLIAFSTLYFLCKLLQQIRIKSSLYNIAQMVSIDQKQMKSCARQVCLFWQKASNSKQFQSLKAKYQSPQLYEVSNLKIKNFTSNAGPISCGKKNTNMQIE